MNNLYPHECCATCRFFKPTNDPDVGLCRRKVVFKSTENLTKVDGLTQVAVWYCCSQYRDK